jgi:uncharacterized protein
VKAICRLIVTSFALSAALCNALTVAEIDRLRMHADAGRDAGALRALINAAQNGNIDAQRAAGEVLLRDTDSTQQDAALMWLQRAAAQDDVRATLLLGKASLHGGAQRPPDYARALRWLGRAHAMNSPQAAYYLGVMHKSGYGTVVNKSRAQNFFTLAATGGIADAMYELGNAYMLAEGVDEDRREAMRWFLKAAALEHPLAIQEIANAYSRGDSLLPQSELQAALMLRAIDHALKHRKAPP